MQIALIVKDSLEEITSDLPERPSLEAATSSFADETERGRSPKDSGSAADRREDEDDLDDFVDDDDVDDQGTELLDHEALLAWRSVDCIRTLRRCLACTTQCLKAVGQQWTRRVAEIEAVADQSSGQSDTACNDAEMPSRRVQATFTEDLLWFDAVRAALVPLSGTVVDFTYAAANVADEHDALYAATESLCDAQQSLRELLLKGKADNGTTPPQSRQEEGIASLKELSLEETLLSEVRSAFGAFFEAVEQLRSSPGFS